MLGLLPVKVQRAPSSDRNESHRPGLGEKEAAAEGKGCEFDTTNAVSKGNF